MEMTKTKAILKALEGSLGAGILQVGTVATKLLSSDLAPHLDPKTKEWIEKSLEKTFGYPSVARFSWTTVKVALEKSAHAIKWSVSLPHSSCSGC